MYIYSLNNNTRFYLILTALIVYEIICFWSAVLIIFARTAPVHLGYRSK